MDSLVVVSKVKAFVKEKGFKTSAEVVTALTEVVMETLVGAIENAKADGRVTLKGKDIIS